MKFNDLFAGGLLVLLAGLTAYGSWGLPNPSQQPLGPSAFPLILAGLLAFCALLLAVHGARTADGAPLLSRADWARDGTAVLRLMLVPAAVVFYVLAAEPLGFLLTAALLLVVLFRAGGVRLLPAAGLSLAAALVIHSLFYLGLGVQLPWGVLEPYRW